MMVVERESKLRQGDLLVKLIDQHGIRAIDIARETDRRPADISEMLKTARAFPAVRRPTGTSYNSLLLATRMVAKFPELRMTPDTALARTLSQRVSQHRDATRYFAGLARNTRLSRPRLTGPSSVEAIDVPCRPYFGRFQDLLTTIPDRSITMLHIDPPFVYGTRMFDSRSARSLACDSDDPESAIALVIDLLRDWQPKLTTDGVALL